MKINDEGFWIGTSRMLMFVSLWLLFIQLIMGLSYNNYYNKPQVGEIYKYDPINNNDDPFFDYEFFVDTVKVINVKNGYIQYVSIVDEDTASTEIIFFNNRTNKINRSCL